MTQISLKVNGASATAVVDGKITSGMVGVPVLITYDNSWDGLTKTASFRVGSFSRSRENIGSSTTVPWEVLRHSGSVLYVGVEGKDKDGNIIMPTVWVSCGTIKDGAVSGIPGAPSPKTDIPTGGGSSIDDSAISYNSTWSSQKIVSEIYKVDANAVWTKGGLQSADGNTNGLDTRARTEFINTPYLFISFPESIQVFVCAYSAENKASYLGWNGAFLNSPVIVSDIVPKGTRFVRICAKYTDGRIIEDVNAIASAITVGTTAGTTSDPYADYEPDVPESIGVLNAILNFKQLTELQYTTKAVLPSQAGDFAANKEFKGLPYSSSRPEAGFVPNFVSMHTFMTALQNPNSYLYTVDLGELGNSNGDTYYGAVCSTSCGHALNIIPNYSTHQWKDVPGMNPLEWQSAHALKLGDTICNRTSGHVVMVTDITRNKRGRIGKITTSEAAPPRCLSKTYTPEELEARFPTEDFVYYRYNKIHEVKHVQSPFVAVEDETPQEVTYNTALIPRKGDKANWLAGVPVEIDVLEGDKYTTAEIYKDDALIKTVALSGGGGGESDDDDVVTVDRTIYGLMWANGGINTADGNVNSATNRVNTGYISTTDIFVTIPSDTRFIAFFYDAEQSYISCTEEITSTSPISVAELAPENAKFVRLWFAYADNSDITDAEAFGSTVLVEVSEESAAIPVLFEGGGLSSSNGAEITNGARVRTDYLPLQNQAVVADSSLNYYIYYYDENKAFIGNSGGWASDSTELLTSAPEGTAYIRLLIKNANNANINVNDLGLYSAKVNLAILGGVATVADDSTEATDLITLTDLAYGSYKARLTDGTNHSDWCYWMVVDAVSTATPTGNAGEAMVTFSASNATPLFIGWNHGTGNGTEHISIPTAEEFAEGTAVCSYQAGSYKLRVAFQTEYGIIHSELPDAITV